MFIAPFTNNNWAWGSATQFFNNGNVFFQGNVGLGIVPNEKLEVAGNRLFNGSISSSIIGVIGGQVSLINPSKTSNGIAKIWKIYNMTGDYGNSIQFWAYDNGGCKEGGLCGNKFTIMDNGYVGIGTAKPDAKLSVAGGIHAQEVKVTVNAGADFVFEDNYGLPSLDMVASFIKENKHLPEIASAKEMQANGINLSEMNIKLLQKVEELTLYTIEQEEKLQKQNDEIEIHNKTSKTQNKILQNQQKLIETLAKRLDRLERK